MSHYPRTCLQSLEMSVPRQTTDVASLRSLRLLGSHDVARSVKVCTAEQEACKDSM